MSGTSSISHFMSREVILQNIKQLPEWRSALVVTLITGLLTLIGYALVSELVSPLRRYPGPFFARWTNVWRLLLSRTGRYTFRIKELHDKYGPIVRIGPNLLDLDYPELIKTIYGTDGKWQKTGFYQNSSTIINGKIAYHLFSEINQAEHARIKRPIVKYYSQGSVLNLEPLMGTVLRDFCGHLDERFVRGSSDGLCDLGEWIGYCAWDMNGAASFSQRFGYMDKGHDYDGSIAIADTTIDYFTAVGQMPFLDFLLDKNPVLRIGPPNLGKITKVALGHLISRLQGKDTNFDPKTPDFLQHFIDAKTQHPQTVDDNLIMGYLLVNLLAGADTTAITIRAIFYHTLKNMDTYRKLEQEILDANLGDVASFNSARALPYLEAVVREATRIHPAVGMLLERYVPEPGLPLPDGSLVPAGTAVGLSPYITGRNKGIWGKDADVYRPERWLRGHAPGPADETQDAYRERMRLFNVSDLTFGGGSRICIGRSFALMEVYKLVATLVGRYHIELADPEAEWEVMGVWFTRQKGLKCRLRAR